MSVSIDAIPPLEEYLQSEPMDTMNLDKYVSLLRLYQFYPQKMSDRNVFVMVFKALMLGFEENCFGAIFYLVPEHMWEREEMKEMLQLQDRLERCAFEVLWRELHYVVDLCHKTNFDNFPIESKLRIHILRILRIAYTKVPIRTFLEFLNFTTVEEALQCAEVKANSFELDRTAGYWTVTPLDGSQQRSDGRPQNKMDAANFLRAQVPVDMLGPILCPPTSPFCL